MSFRVVFSDKALKQMKKLDKYTASLILAWLRKNLEGCEESQETWKGLNSQ